MVFSDIANSGGGTEMTSQNGRTSDKIQVSGIEEALWVAGVYDDSDEEETLEENEIGGPSPMTEDSQEPHEDRGKQVKAHALRVASDEEDDYRRRISSVRETSEDEQRRTMDSKMKMKNDLEYRLFKLEAANDSYDEDPSDDETPKEPLYKTEENKRNISELKEKIAQLDIEIKTLQDQINNSSTLPAARPVREGNKKPQISYGIQSQDRMEAKESMGKSGIPENVEKQKYLKLWKVDVLDKAALFGKLRREHKSEVNDNNRDRVEYTEELGSKARGVPGQERTNIQVQEQRVDFEKEKAQLEKITEEIVQDSRVKKARALYKNPGNKFKDGLFKSIRKGNLRDVQAKVVALILENSEDNALKNMKDNNLDYPLLHAALIYHQDEIAKFLAEHSGKLLTTQEKDHPTEYTNLTPLHLALCQGKYQVIEKIVESLPDHEKTAHINRKIPIKTYMGKPYGELPLATTTWACMKNRKSDEIKEILHYLVGNGADMDMKTETDGNSLLHLIVLQVLECRSELDYFRNFLKKVFWPAAKIWWTKKNKEPEDPKIKSKKFAAMSYLLNFKNKEGLTPVALAAKVESPLYVDLAQWEGVVCFRDTKCQFTPQYTYNVENIISVDIHGKYKDTSVMHVLAHNPLDLGDGRSNVDIADTEPLRTLIETKWDFYRWFFYTWGICHIVYMILFTSFTLHDTAVNPVKPIAANESGSAKINQASAQELRRERSNPMLGLFLLVPISYFCFEVFDFISVLSINYIRNITSKRGPVITGNFFYRLLSLLHTLFSITWFWLHMQRNVNQDVLLAMTLLFGWLFCIFFTRTLSFPTKSSQIGAFSIIVQRMLFHDLVPFLLISFFVITSFSTAIQATLTFTNPSSNAEFSFGNTYYQMIKYFAALDDPMSESSSRQQQFAKALLVVYGIIIVVLLINMLIAAMNKSYDTIRSTNCNLVRRQRLSILLMLERRLFCCRKLPQERFLGADGKWPHITVSHQSVVGELIGKRSTNKSNRPTSGGAKTRKSRNETQC